jgi:uncharacterized protein YukE
MSDYKVNTAELRAAATQLINQANEMRVAVQRVESAVSPARGMIAPRVAKNIAQWDAIKASLEKMFAESETASNIIKTTAEEIDIVMN